MERNHPQFLIKPKHMTTLGIAGIVSHDTATTQKYNQLLRLIGTEGMLTQFERFVDHYELEGLIAQVEESLSENDINLPY